VARSDLVEVASLGEMLGHAAAELARNGAADLFNPPLRIQHALGAVRLGKRHHAIGGMVKIHGSHIPSVADPQPQADNVQLPMPNGHLEEAVSVG
jgi:hypothetical protein